MPAQEEFLGEESLGDEYMGVMPVQEEFLGEKSSPKCLCKKSSWVKRRWVTNIWVKSMCKKSF